MKEFLRKLRIKMGNKKKYSNAFKERIFKIITAALIMIARKCDVEANANGQINQINIFQESHQALDTPAQFGNQQQANLYGQPQQFPQFAYKQPTQSGNCLILEMMEEIFSCEKLDHFDMLRELIHVLNTRQNVYDAIHLHLTEIQFPDVGNPSQKLPMNWFPVVVSVRVLVLTDLSVTGIENDAFNSPQFTYLEVLTIRGVKVPYLAAGMFNGLANLKKLNIVNPNLESIEKYALAPLRNLKIFNVWECGLHLLSLDNLFDTVMYQLKQVTIVRCLSINTIHEATFSGLVNVQDLRLVGNGIEHIGERSFDVVLKTLMVLSLVGNQLKTISADLFKIEHEGVVNIYLDKNPWHCNYKLEDLRQFIQNTYTYRFIEIVCNKPEEYKGLHLSMCSDLSEVEVAVAENVGGCLNIKLAFNDEILSCKKLDHFNMLRELSQVLNTKMNHNDPVNLQLSQILFSATTRFIPKLPKNWFPMEVSVKGLLLNELFVTGIETDAFNSPQFANLEVLSLRGTKIPYLAAGMFSGLAKLKVLNIISPNLESIQKYALALLKNLERLEIRQCGPHVLWLDNLFDTEMHQLKQVIVIGCLLTNTINEATFSGLVNVQDLRLLGNGIEQIGERSFDVILKTLMVLSLAGNQLKTISTDLFKIEHEGVVNIYLDKNPWHCDRGLEDLRVFMKTTKMYRFTDIVCYKPEEYKGLQLSMCSYLGEVVRKEETKEVTVVAAAQFLGETPAISQQSPQFGYQQSAQSSNQQRPAVYGQPQQSSQLGYQQPAQFGTCQKKEMMDKSFSCVKLRHFDMLRELSQVLNTRQNVNDPINLQLSQIQFSDVKNPNQKLPKNWFSLKASVNSLLLNELTVTGIENDAFNSPQFAHLEVLSLRGTKIPSLSAEMFSGLTNLKVLNIGIPNLESIEKYALAPLQNLEVFNLWHCGPLLFSLDNLFDTVMYQLKNVTIVDCPLTNTINEATFSGLVNVQDLRLATSGIEHIGERSFDVVLKTLTVLSLMDNRLKTISADLFKIKREGIGNIYLGQNPWHCDCKLEDMRTFIKNSKTYSFSDINCITPEKYKDKSLVKCTDLCEDKENDEEDYEEEYEDEEGEEGEEEEDQETDGNHIDKFTGIGIIAADETPAKPLKPNKPSEVAIPFEFAQPAEPSESDQPAPAASNPPENGQGNEDPANDAETIHATLIIDWIVLAITYLIIYHIY